MRVRFVTPSLCRTCAADSGISWLIPSVAHLLPDVEPFDAEGWPRAHLSVHCRDLISACGWLATPTAILQELLDGSASASAPASEVNNAVASLGEDSGVLEALPDWQNPDGEALLAAALRQEDPPAFAIPKVSTSSRFLAIAVWSKVSPCCR